MLSVVTLNVVMVCVVMLTLSHLLISVSYPKLTIRQTIGMSIISLKNLRGIRANWPLVTGHWPLATGISNEALSPTK
jgi:hypothetical protein